VLAGKKKSVSVNITNRRRNAPELSIGALRRMIAIASRFKQGRSRLPANAPYQLMHVFKAVKAPLL